MVRGWRLSAWTVLPQRTVVPRREGVSAEMPAAGTREGSALTPLDSAKLRALPDPSGRRPHPALHPRPL